MAAFPPMVRFYEASDIEHTKALPLFNWDMVQAVPLTKQKAAEANGMECYPPMPVVMGARENSFFGLSTGKKESEDGGGGGDRFGGTVLDASASIAPSGFGGGGGGGRQSQKRRGYEKTVTNEHAEEWQTRFLDGFKAWCVKNWDVLHTNYPTFNERSSKAKKKKYDTDEKRLASIEKRLRGPLKEKTAEILEKYPKLAEQPFTVRYKLIEVKCPYTSKLCIADAAGNIDQVRDVRGRNVPRAAAAEEITAHSDVMEGWVVHLIFNPQNIDITLLVRHAIAFQEAEAAAVDWTQFGATLAPAGGSAAADGAELSTADRVAAFTGVEQQPAAAAAAAVDDDGDSVMGGGGMRDEATALAASAVM